MDSPISTKAAILATLAQEHSYGSAIIERVSDVTGGRLVLHSGGVYPALMALERDGLIRKMKMSYSADYPARTVYYELTKKGKDVLDTHREIASIVFLGSPILGLPKMFSGVSGMAYNPL